MRRLLFVTLFVAIGLTLLRKPDTSGLICSVVLWLFVIAWAASDAFRASSSKERLAAVVFLAALALYSILALIPDQEHHSPRRVGKEWTTKAIRMGFEPLTGWHDFELQGLGGGLNRALGDGDRSSTWVSPSLNKALTTDGEEIENLLESIDQIMGSTRLEKGVRQNQVIVATLTGFGPFLEFERHLKGYMWKCHMFMGLLIAYFARLFGLTLLALRYKFLS